MNSRHLGVLVAAVLAALVVAVPPVVAGGTAVGGLKTGGVVAGSGSQLGPGCVTTATGIYCGELDAGVLFVQGGAQLGGGLLKVGAVVDIATDLNVTTGNDAIFNRNARVNGDFTIAGVKFIADTAPTVAACSGGTAASMTWNTHSAVFQFDVGTSCAGESTATITFGEAAANGFVCHCENKTTADRAVHCLSGSATTAVCTNVVISTGAAGDWADGADVWCICFGG